MTGTDIRRWLIVLAFGALAAGTAMVIFAGLAIQEAFAPFGGVLLLLGGQQLPAPATPAE